MAWENLLNTAIQAGISLYNLDQQKKTNEANRQWQANENAITRAREDNAHQREVADLEKAGLSPLASVEGAKTSQGIVTSQEAPQIDGGALNDAIKVLSEREMNEKTLEETKRQHDENLSHEEKLLEEQKRQFNENQKLTKEIENTKIKNEVEKFLIEEERLNNEIEITSETASRQNKIRLSEVTIQEYNDLCKNWSYNFKQNTSTDYQEYLIQKQKFDTQLKDFIDFFRGKGVKEPNLSESGSGAASLGAGASSGTSTNSWYGKQGGGSGTNSSSNLGISASGSGSWTRSGEWIKQGNMSQYIHEYCEKKNIKPSEFMIFPIYKPTNKDLNTQKRTGKKGNWSYLY